MEEAVAITIKLELYARPMPVAAVSSMTTGEDNEPVVVVSSEGTDIHKLTERLARFRHFEDTQGHKTEGELIRGIKAK